MLYVLLYVYVICVCHTCQDRECNNDVRPEDLEPSQGGRGDGDKNPEDNDEGEDEDGDMDSTEEGEEGTMQIFVRMPPGNVITLNVNESYTVHVVKAIIQDT